MTLATIITNNWPDAITICTITICATVAWVYWKMYE